MFQASTEKKVAVFLADGFEEIEALTVVDLLYRAGIPVTTVSIGEEREVVSSHEITVKANTTIGALDFAQYDMIVLPGGMPGTIHLKECQALTEQVSAFHRAGKPLAAICAAPTILAELGLLEGKPATCFPDMEPQMKGAVLTHGAVAVTDDRIITGRGMGCAIPFSLAIVAYYLGQETADLLAGKIVYE
ncbi:MAG: DJ-1/PfpI family protein [Eubacteriales bacterium]|nr:DJ-1/PfpI family protein [Eubacteriales bacterium]